MQVPGRFARLKTKRGAWIAIGSLGALGVGAFALVYFVLFPTSSPKPFSLAVSTSGSSSTKLAAQATASATNIAGTWKVGTGSKAGYRVREKLVFLPAQSDAVDRPSKVSGSLTLATSENTLGMTAPNLGGAVSVNGKATMEFDLHLVRS